MKSFESCVCVKECTATIQNLERRLDALDATFEHWRMTRTSHQIPKGLDRAMGGRPRLVTELLNAVAARHDARTACTACTAR